MLKNYLKTAFRNIKRNKAYAIINTSGLTVGITACLLIFLVVQFQTSFDNFHPKKDSIYRVGSQFHHADGIDYSDAVPFPVEKGLRIDFPDIKQVANIFRSDGQITLNKNGEQQEKIVEKNFFYAQPEFFKMFNFPFLKGNPEQVLKDPNNAVLTESAAKKYFGSVENAMGKTFTFQNKDLFTVAGILKDIPKNSDFPIDVVVPYSALDKVKQREDDWLSIFGGLNTFIVLPPNVTPAQMQVRLDAFAKKHKPADYSSDSYVLQPLSEIHFDERFGNYNKKTFSHSLINALSMIGLFLLIIACVNFINLATAQAVNRSREVGVRKVLGSSRRQLVLQFLSEIGVIVFAACVFAVLIASLALPFLNQLLETNMTFNWLQNGGMALFLLAVFVIGTLLSGIYPAFILSGFNPIKALKNKVTVKSAGGISLRRALVVFQFVIAQVLIIAMLIVVDQLKFFRSASLGFDRAEIVTVRLPDDSTGRSRIDYLRNKLLSNASIRDVSFSFAAPSSTSNWNSDFNFDHSSKATNFNANLKWADPEYFKMYGLTFIAGKPYEKNDTVNGFVVNQTLLNKLGIKDASTAIGKQMDFWDGELKGEIVGVIKDFNSYSLRDPMAPVVLGTYKDTYRTVNIKLKPGSEKSGLSFIEDTWNSTFPKDVFIYKFLDETIENYYKSEDQLATLYKIFAAIAIFISCLGLYGLVSFMAVQRTKEVGVRKVLGATSMNIVYLLSKELTLLVIIAFAIAAPIAWFMMHAWLQDFTYRISVGPLIFIMAIAGSIFISWITVGYKAMQAANADPIKSLRSE